MKTKTDPAQRAAMFTAVLHGYIAAGSGGMPTPSTLVSLASRTTQVALAELQRIEQMQTDADVSAYLWPQEAARRVQ